MILIIMIKYIFKYIYLLIGIILLGIVIILGVRINSLKKDLDTSITNEKAFMSELSVLEEKNKVYKLTIEQLNYFNDSISIKLKETIKELNIKTKDLEYLQYLYSTISKKDTIRFIDTIFKNEINIDTSIGNYWYNLELSLKFPNFVSINPKFKSEKYIVTYFKKETINPPKKCAFLRFFQRKHKVMEVEVIEKNPYINNKEQRFIQILK